MIVSIPTTQSEKFQLLESLGFQTPPHREISCNEIGEFFDQQIRDRDSLNYDIDGLVFSVNSLGRLAQLGYVDRNCPRGQIALKFPAKGSVVTIREVIWSADGGAHLSPIAIFDPIELAGATIRRASLKSYRWLTSRQARIDHFRAEARALGQTPEQANIYAVERAASQETVGVGSVVSIVRSGDIIPTVTGVISNIVGEANVPQQCPCCQSPTAQNGAFLDCVNPECPGKEANRMRRFLTRLHIKGLGQDTLVLYAEAGVTLLDFFADDGFAIVEDKIRKKGSISLNVWSKVKAQLVSHQKVR